MDLLHTANILLPLFTAKKNSNNSLSDFKALVWFSVPFTLKCGKIYEILLDKGCILKVARRVITAADEIILSGGVTINLYIV